jgi:hypothetical protein
MAQQAAPAAQAAVPAAPAFRIALNIDITGSMGHELSGVKAYCAELASLCQDLEVPVSMAVVTFTENKDRCYVSLNEFQVRGCGLLRSMCICHLYESSKLGGAPSGQARHLPASWEAWDGIICVAFCWLSIISHMVYQSARMSSAPCFVCCQDLAAARTFVEGLRLGVPPDHPGVTADGGDGEENQKAALYRMTELDPTVPTISFLITDAGPHFKLYGDRPEARAELAWLQDKGLDPQVRPWTIVYGNMLT